MSDKTLRVDFSTSEHSPFGRAIGRAMYHNQELFSIVRTDYCPHTGGQHRLVVKATLPDLLAYFDVMDETLGKFAEVEVARSIVDYMIRKQIPIGAGDKLNVAQIRREIRQALKLNTSVYLPENQLAPGNAAIQRTLDAILQPGTVRDPLRMNLAILVEQCMEEAADEFAEQILMSVASTDVALAMIDGKGEE